MVERTPAERVAAALEGLPRLRCVAPPALARALREAGLDRGEARAAMGDSAPQAAVTGAEGAGAWAGYGALWGAGSAFLSGLAPLPASKLSLRVRDAVVEAVLLPMAQPTAAPPVQAFTGSFYRLDTQ